MSVERWKVEGVAMAVAGVVLMVTVPAFHLFQREVAATWIDLGVYAIGFLSLLCGVNEIAAGGKLN